MHEKIEKKKRKGKIKRATLNVNTFTGGGWTHGNGTNSKAGHGSFFHLFIGHLYHLAPYQR